MAYSKISYIGDGSTTSYTTPSYIEKSHIAVWVDGNLSFEHSWTGPNTITFNTAPASGAVIEIVRNSSQQTRLVNYQQPSPLDAETLNRDSKQAFYMAQEALDEASLALHRTPDGDSYDAEGNPIINVGSPTNGNDAATKSYVDITVATGVPGGPITLFTVADYTELRGLTAAAYAANRVFVTSPAPGEFWHDAADTTSADNGGVIIVDADGRRWKRLAFFSGYVCPTWWGAKPGGDATDNTTAIQACFDAYTGLPGTIVPKILFTRKGTYQIDDTLIIRGFGFTRFAFHIDFGMSALQQVTDNVPILSYVGGAEDQWKFENGYLLFLNTQPNTNTEAVCLSFRGGPNDAVSSNGPNLGVISRMEFGKGAIGIGTGPNDPSDSAYTIWDVRIEYCKFIACTKHAIYISAHPDFSTAAKNITVRSCYIQDQYLSGSTDPILHFRSIMLLNIDDLEVIQTIRPVMYATSVVADIRTVSIENPGTSSTPFPATCPYLFRFLKSPTTIDGLNLCTLRSDVGSGNRMPLIVADSDEFQNTPVTCGMIDLFRLDSVSGGFTLFGGNQYGRIIHSTPATYRETSYNVCPLFEFDGLKANSAVLAKSVLTYFPNKVTTVSHTTGVYTLDLGNDDTTCLVVGGAPTGNITVNVFPVDTATSMSSNPHVGPGRSITVRRVNTGAFTFTVNWGSATFTIPADKVGFVTLTFAPPSGWAVTSASIY